jgi:hypothetical protein
MEEYKAPGILEIDNWTEACKTPYFRILTEQNWGSTVIKQEPVKIYDRTTNRTVT